MKQLSQTLCAVFFFLLVITGCTTTKVAPNAANLQVELKWTAANKCSSVSPEIRVTGIPSTTKQLKISMIDLDKPDFNHGGGTVKYDGSNVIPAGGLKSYTGPCPPSGQHSYSIKVDAIDVSGVIVGSGKQAKPCCP